MRKMVYLKWFLLILAVCTSFVGVWYIGYSAGEHSSGTNAHMDNIIGSLPNSINNKFYRNANMVDFSNLSFTPWNVDAASATLTEREIKPYTIMVYMNGSDLESEMGAATSDIFEMQNSAVNSEHVNLILFTGGTNRWHNNLVSSNSCMIWEISDGKINKLCDVGLVNMGDPGTLASFIDFSFRNFPADKFGLIMWDHGGGSIAGFGHDEKFNNSYLSLLDMNYAFEQSELANNKLEFLGFDSCLMATVEMAVIASEYANYLIASEDIEPFDGWDYSFLSAINKNPQMNGAEMGIEIVNSFMDYYPNNSKQSLAMSVIDLSKVDRVMGALGALMKPCSDSLHTDGKSSFKTLSKKRNGTKTFGVGSPRDNECDMVDIGDMADKLSELYPVEAANVLSELNNCVVYNRHNSNIDLKGLSVYYIYGGKEIGTMSLNTYDTLSMNADYTKYLNEFFERLQDGKLTDPGRSVERMQQGENMIVANDLVGIDFAIWQPIDDRPGSYIMTGIQSGLDTNDVNLMKTAMNSLWPVIDGKNVCLFQISSTNNSALYAIPASLNQKDCDIIVLFDKEYPHGKILGVRQEDGLVIQKGYDDILQGDKVAFYYLIRQENTETIDWYLSETFTVNEDMSLDWILLSGEYYYSFCLTDMYYNEYFTELVLINTPITEKAQDVHKKDGSVLFLLCNRVVQKSAR